MARYDSILGTIGNTPVVRINRLAPKGVNLFVKVEAFNPLGSVKDRLALGVIEAAEQSGDLKPGQTVVTAGVNLLKQGQKVKILAAQTHAGDSAPVVSAAHSGEAVK